MTEFQKKVWRITKRIPQGKVSTYKKIAQALGQLRAARAIGQALNKNNDSFIPCHRVIKSDGTLGGYKKGSHQKRELLIKEGVAIKGGKINLNKYLFKNL